MQEIKFNCYHCGQPLEAPNNMRGEIMDCPQCQRSLVIPETTTVPKRIACPFCAEIILESAKKCKHCGGVLTGSEKRILPLLILAIFLGIFGIHAFYAGRWGQGIIYIVLLCTFWLGIPVLLLCALLLLCAFLFGDLIRILIGVCWGRSLTLTFRFPSSPDTRTVDRCKALSVFNRTIIPSEVPQLPCHGNTLPHRENALHPLNV